MGFVKALVLFIRAAVRVLLIKPSAQLLPKMPVAVVGLADSVVMLLRHVDTFILKPWVGTVIGIAYLCLTVVILIIAAFSIRQLDIGYTILLYLLVLLFLAGGTVVTLKAWKELKRKPETNPASKNYPYHRII